MNIKKYKSISNFKLDKSRFNKKLPIKIICGFLLAANLLGTSVNVYAKDISNSYSVEENLTLDEINEISKEYGKFVIDGMSSEDYLEVTDYEIKQVEVVGEKKGLGFDIENSYTYLDIENILLDYAKNDDTVLNIIGHSVQGRNIYSIEIGTGSKVILLTGGVHSRETAGTSFIMKQLFDLLNEKDSNNKIKELLKEFTIVAVPCANPDGRVVLESDPNSMKKSNINGVDLGRNFPSTNAGQLKNNSKIAPNYSKVPADAFYAGENLGSEPETKALMRLFMKYASKTVIYMDQHQAGQMIYTGKPAGSLEFENGCYEFSNSLVNFTSKNGLKYDVHREDPELRGYGEGTTTDFFNGLVEGSKYSPVFGRFAMNTEDGLKPLLFYEDSENVMQYNKKSDVFLASLTYEIGSMDSRGYTEHARRLQSIEYEKLNMKNVIEFMMEYSYKKLYGDQHYQNLLNSLEQYEVVSKKVLVEANAAINDFDLKNIQEQLKILKKYKEEYFDIFNLKSDEILDIEQSTK